MDSSWTVRQKTGESKNSWRMLEVASSQTLYTIMKMTV